MSRIRPDHRGPFGRAPREDDHVDSQALREANRHLLAAGLEASAQADTQTSVAAALRQLLEVRDQEEQAFHGELEVLRSITNNVSVAIVLVDSLAHPIYLNPAAQAMFGYTLAEIAHAPMHDAAHHHRPDGRPFPIEECTVAAALLSRTTLRDHQDFFVRKDGTFFPARSDVSPLEVSGRSLGAVWEVRDRTREARAEQAKEEYVALIAHDLRTPLTALRGHAELLARRLKQKEQGDDAMLRGLATIVRDSQRMEAMIQDLIESSHLESGALLLRRGPTDLSRLAAGVITEFVSEGDRHRIRVVAPADAPVVPADRERIERVLMNLLQNALKYSPADSPVDLEIRRGAGEVVVGVIDRGMGIPADELSRIFQRFARAGRAEPGPAGFGLGLYIARLIVEAHGGRVWAESDVGSGSRIGFALPLDASNDPAIGEDDQPRSA